MVKYPLAAESPQKVIDRFVEHGPDILEGPDGESTWNEESVDWELKNTKQLTIEEYKEQYENSYPGGAIHLDWHEERGIRFAFLVELDLLNEDGENVVYEKVGIRPIEIDMWYLDRL